MTIGISYDIGISTGGGGGSAVTASTSTPLAPIDATGAIGTSTNYARADHKHPSAGVSNTLNNSLTIGADGLHSLIPVNNLTSTSSNLVLSAAQGKILNDLLAIEILETGALTYNSVTTILTYTNSKGIAQNIDLSALTTDIFVNGATFNAATTVLTLTDNNLISPDVVINLATLRSVLTANVNGTYTHNDGNGTIVVIDPRANSTAISPAPTDAIGAVGISSLRAREDHKHPAAGVSADAGNLLTIGTDGLHLNTKSQFIYTIPNALLAWGTAAAGYYRVIIPALTHGIAAATTVIVQENVLGVNSTIVPDHTNILANGDVEIVVSDIPDGRFIGRVLIS